MLSAICLVNYFEGGSLPRDRAVLYKLCVEGLLHHWDQRRGIRSDFSLEEKLRACRNVALVMQAEDRAEYPHDLVEASFEQTLGDAGRAKRLLEHVRNRTGLLLERRAGIFAFAHLTFQEYLTACAVHEGNPLDIDGDRLIAEHTDGRWEEVIALYCGLSPTPAARSMIERLLAAACSDQLGSVLADAYLAAGPELAGDHALRLKVIRRVAALPSSQSSQLLRFSAEDVAPSANELLGRGESPSSLSAAAMWFLHNKGRLDPSALEDRLRLWRTLSLAGLTEVTLVAHFLNILQGFITEPEIYLAPALSHYGSQAGVGLLFFSIAGLTGSDCCRALYEIFRAIGLLGAEPSTVFYWDPRRYPPGIELYPDIARLARLTALRLQNDKHREQLVAWAEALERQEGFAERKPTL